MSIALYFGKINMSSSQLGDVLINNASFRTILSNVLAYFNTFLVDSNIWENLFLFWEYLFL